MKARVANGRLVLDEPTALPEGTEIELEPVDEGDQLDDADRRRLHGALDQAEREIAQGLGRSADDVLADLRSRFPGA
jgi:hypothetical protein